MEITVKVKSVYGNEQIYPVCKQAQIFAEIAGTKTLTPHTLRMVKILGYNVLHAAEVFSELQLNSVTA